jgi:glycosyltransferase involved in cell wall biosynthesis
MPLNEFALYRIRNHLDEGSAVVSWRASLPAISNCEKYFDQDNKKLLACNGSVMRLIRYLRKTIKQYREKKFRVVLHLHQPASGIFVSILKPLFFRNISAIYTIHSTFRKYSLKNKVLTIVNFLCADQTVFVSRASMDAFPKLLIRLKMGQAEVIRNGVDTEEISKVLHQKVMLSENLFFGRVGTRTTTQNHFRIVVAGRLIGLKNHKFLIKLMPDLPDNVELVIVGGGELENTLRDLAREQVCSERILFTGMVERNKVYEIMQASNVFVSPSYWEGLPIAVIEAMGLGMPVILSDIGPHREIAERSPGVLIAPVDDAKTWIDEIRRLDNMSSEGLKAIGRLNHESVVNHFSLKEMHIHYSRIYNRLMS